jgi:hypothetical protein
VREIGVARFTDRKVEPTCPHPTLSRERERGKDPLANGRRRTGNKGEKKS